MPRPVRAVVALLDAWLADAKAGNVRGVFVLGRGVDKEWDDAYAVDDAGDLILELRSARMRVIRDCNDDEAAPCN